MVDRNLRLWRAETLERWWIKRAHARARAAQPTATVAHARGCRKAGHKGTDRLPLRALPRCLKIAASLATGSALPKEATQQLITPRRVPRQPTAPPKGQLICPHAQCGCRALGQRWQPAPTPRAERARADAVELPPLMKPRWGSKGTTSSAVTLCRLGLYLRRDVGEERASKADNYDRYGDQDEGVPIA